MYIEHESQPVEPETRLWKAVLWRAFDDTLYRGIEKSLIVAKKAAQKWFRLQSPDYSNVCMFASYDPKYVADKYQKISKTVAWDTDIFCISA